MIVLYNVIVVRVSYRHSVKYEIILLYATSSSTIVQVSAQLILAQLSLRKDALLIQFCD